jgi:predicted SprT family Zn-dependent metalloprotease
MMGKSVNKTWTSDEIRNYMKDFVLKMDKDDRETIGDVIDIIPISIDGRLKSSMGYFSGKYKRSGEFISPVKFKFSKRINSYDNDTVKHIIQHELIHLLSDKKHGRNTSHYKEWKELCCKYKVNDDEFFTPNLELEKDYHRYHIYCNECGKLVGTRDRLSKEKIIQLLLYGRHQDDYGKLRIYDNKEKGYIKLNNIMVNDGENN